MEEEQFLLVLPSNSSMRHFPDNTTSSFITELPHSIVLHGQWEVATTKIQFPCTFLHIRHKENVIRFIDVKPDEGTKGAFTAKEVAFPNGIYNDIYELIDAINTACKEAESHFYFELQKASGGEVMISINCDEKCQMLHHINFSDNLLRMLGFSSAISANNYPLYPKLAIRKPNSNETEEKTFLTHGFNKETGKRLADLYWSTEPYSLWRGIPDKMFVYCDICEPYIIGDVGTPLLGIVPVEIRNHNYAFGANLVKHFSFPNYIPLRRTNFRTIEIDIRDHLGKKIPFEFGTLTVTLHFKRKQ
ncbi:hypothetical protein ALC57_18386 [Trachymyrmex cornetzi]|uniref:Uncharacterized protein n=1 Tax=Trachymyrmex cornetzi TaxID=471704 RepID=A0A151IS14_9HYME|nr:hypothetical protein ALC57_18386 [Trachymyrmex cornetzi]